MSAVHIPFADICVDEKGKTRRREANVLIRCARSRISLNPSDGDKHII